MMRPCGRQLFELIPRGKLRVNLDLAEGTLRDAGYEIVDCSELVLSVRKKHEISLYPNGKMIVFPVETDSEAARVGENILSILKNKKDCLAQL